MAILELENGTIYNSLEDIARELAPLQVSLNRWEVNKDPAIAALIAKENLDNEQKEKVLKSLDRYFEKLKTTAGYQSRDLIVLYPEFPNLSQLLSKFASCHIHADDEVRYVIDGEGVFGFVRPDRSQVELTIQPEEYINVPAGTEHWFHLTQSNRIKAVRYFTTTEGWTPEYTGTEKREFGVGVRV
jgi:1,2-dihydroxy-3-keto-5-methylthiopentene dioxygenase